MPLGPNIGHFVKFSRFTKIDFFLLVDLKPPLQPVETCFFNLIKKRTLKHYDS